MKRSLRYLLLPLAVCLLPSCDGCGSDDEKIVTVAPAPPPVPGDPLGLIATALSTGRIDLSWTDGSTNEDGFRIERSDDNVTFLEIAVVGPGITAWVSLGLAPNNQYWYRVRAFNTGGSSAYTNTASATTFNAVWSGALAAGPAGRSQHAAVYDSVNQQMVIYGGANLGGPLADVWTFSSGGAWTNVTPGAGPPAPGPRFFHAAAYDPVFERMIIFGGIAGGPMNDVWAFDLMGGGGWTQLIAASAGPPAPRFAATAIYDPVGQRLIMFGGSGGVELNDLWEIPLTSLGGPFAWNALAPTGGPPLPRSHHTAVYDAASQRMIVFGGIDNDNTDGSALNNEVWSLTLSAGGGTPVWSQMTPTGTPPSFRQSHAAIFDGSSSRMIVFGGFDNVTPITADVWSLDLTGPASWANPTPLLAAPAARMDHRAVYDAFNNRMIIFGGNDMGGPPTFFPDPEALGF